VGTEGHTVSAVDALGWNTLASFGYGTYESGLLTFAAVGAFLLVEDHPSIRFPLQAAGGADPEARRVLTSSAGHNPEVALDAPWVRTFMALSWRETLQVRILLQANMQERQPVQLSGWATLSLLFFLGLGGVVPPASLLVKV